MKINWRKIWCGFAITLSGIAIILSVVGIIGIWIVERPVIGVSDTVLNSAISTSGSIQEWIVDLDQSLETIQTITRDILKATEQLDQAAEQQGLVELLLPEDTEQNIIEHSKKVKDRFESINSTLTEVVNIYTSIDQLPFVSMPMPTKAQVSELEQSLSHFQTSVDSVKENISQLQTQTVGVIEKLQAGTKTALEQIELSRDQLAQMNAALSAFQERAERLKSQIRTIFMLLVILFSLFMIYGIYTQVEVIRMLSTRYRANPAKAKESDV